MHISGTLTESVFIISVGQRIKHLRKRRNLLQEQFAKAAGIGAAALSRIEAGRVNISLLTLNKILKVLDISFADFFKELENYASVDSFMKFRPFTLVQESFLMDCHKRSICGQPPVNVLEAKGWQLLVKSGLLQTGRHYHKTTFYEALHLTDFGTRYMTEIIGADFPDPAEKIKAVTNLYQSYATNNLNTMKRSLIDKIDLR